MSLDGAFLHLVITELLDRGLVGARIDKVYQPSKEEIIVAMRSNGGTQRLLFSANPVSARVCATTREPENPKAPPMFCMLLRKHLGGGKLLSITQDGLERIINFDFICMNEIGDMVTNRLTAEIMGRCSNIILMTQRDNGWRVIDSIKRVTDDISSVRRILPGIVYALPPREHRLSLLDCTRDEVETALSGYSAERLPKALLKVFEGISPIFARECAYSCAKDVDITYGDLSASQRDKLHFFLTMARDAINGSAKPVIVSESGGKPKDFCFMPIEQYGSEMLITPQESANVLLDGFYSIRSANDRMKQRSGDLLKHLLSAYERISRKIELQKLELAKCGERDRFRVCGDILSANIYRMEKGMNELEAEDYLNGGTVKIKLDTRLTPAQNAQKYYAEYRKLDTAEKMLTRLVAEGERELIYVDSVFDEVSRTAGETELMEIRRELYETGYLRSPVKSKESRQYKSLPPMKFKSSDGFEILVGRNNLQNDKLTLKTARPNDLWLHVQKFPGSHTIIVTDGKNVPDNTIVEAATLAAFCSKAREGTKIPVDYTRVRFVKKPSGAKPGMVIFTNNKTILVDPSQELYERLSVKN